MLQVFSFNHIRLQTQRLCNRVGIKSHSSRAPARHLDSAHPQVQAVKTFVSKCEENYGIDKRLICNFDQVWTTMYEHQKRVLHKPLEHAGEMKPANKPSMQKMVDTIRKALMIQSGADASNASESKGYVPAPVILDAQANVSPIEGWRFPRTTTTLSWADGDLGASWITIKEGAASEELVQKLNKELEGLLTIHIQDSKSHMWNSSTMLHYLQCLTIQLRIKRLKHGLTTSSKALVFCDKAAVHATTAFASLRAQWERENAAILCNGSSADYIKVPPGWGAVGAPNDGFHQFYHLLRQSFQKVSSGQARFLKLRASLDQLDLAVDGSVRFTLLDLTILHMIFDDLCIFDIVIKFYDIFVFIY